MKYSLHRNKQILSHKREIISHVRLKRMTHEAFNTKAALTKPNKSLDLFVGKMIIFISNEMESIYLVHLAGQTCPKHLPLNKDNIAFLNALNEYSPFH